MLSNASGALVLSTSGIAAHKANKLYRITWYCAYVGVILVWECYSCMKLAESMNVCGKANSNIFWKKMPFCQAHPNVTKICYCEYSGRWKHIFLMFVMFVLKYGFSLSGNMLKTGNLETLCNKPNNYILNVLYIYHSWVGIRARVQTPHFSYHDDLTCVGVSARIYRLLRMGMRIRVYSDTTIFFHISNWEVYVCTQKMEKKLYWDN